jgi:hypothetical protein
MISAVESIAFRRLSLVAGALVDIEHCCMDICSEALPACRCGTWHLKKAVCVDQQWLQPLKRQRRRQPSFPAFGPDGKGAVALHKICQ